MTANFPALEQLNPGKLYILKRTTTVYDDNSPFISGCSLNKGTVLLYLNSQESMSDIKLMYVRLVRHYFLYGKNTVFYHRIDLQKKNELKQKKYDDIFNYMKELNH